MTTVALIVAAGRGTRAGGALPKQWQRLAGRRMIDWTLAAFRDHPGIDQVLMVINPDDAAEVPAGIHSVAGADSRAGSVLAGLKALQGQGVNRVLIHDAARPCVSSAVIDGVLAALDHHAGAAPGLAITDAVWRGTDVIAQTLDRAGLFRAQTPQGFHFDAILAAHLAHAGNAADDVEVARAAGIGVALTAGDEANFKVTRAQDFERAEARLRGPMDIRTGNGFDVHRFGPGDHVWLCGVKVPFTRTLQGHSDADVGMHAVTDAIYGALGMGDIGQHFPPSDPQWKGAASHIFLAHACALARENGYRITHADCTLVCEFPKIGPHAAAMKAEMARIMGLAPEQVSVKATTSEQLGFTGRGEGIAALASATLVKP